MAGYATFAEMQELIAQFPLSTVSKPTIAQATIIVDDTADEINMRLGAAGIATPVTTPAAFLRMLSLLNCYGAAAAVLKSMFPDATGPGDTPAYAFWEKRYQDGLKALTDGTSIPPDVGSSNANFVLPSTYLTNNPDEEMELGLIAEPMFKVGTKF